MATDEKGGRAGPFMSGIGRRFRRLRGLMGLNPDPAPGVEHFRIRLSISVASVLLLALAIGLNRTFDANAVVLAAFGAMPWLILLVSSLKISTTGFEVVALKSEVAGMRILLGSILTDAELYIMAALSTADAGARRQALTIDMDDAPAWELVKEPLVRLMGLSFVDYSGVAEDLGLVEGDVHGEHDMQDYFRITASGRDFLTLYKQVTAKPLDLQELGTRVFDRLAPGLRKFRPA